MSTTREDLEAIYDSSPLGNLEVRVKNDAGRVNTVDDIPAGEDALEPSEEGRHTVGQKKVFAPSAEEQEAHMRTHIPYRRCRRRSCTRYHENSFRTKHFAVIDKPYKTIYNKYTRRTS